MNLFKHNIIISERRDMVKITDMVKKDIKECGIRNGLHEVTSYPENSILEIYVTY